jgi:hypothetical protein
LAGSRRPFTSGSACDGLASNKGPVDLTMLTWLSYNKPRWQEINLKTNYVEHVDDFPLAGTDHPAGRKK